MSEHPAAYLAFSAPINPSDTTPALTKEQVWTGLKRKVRHAEEFVGGAIESTEVISESKDERGRDVITRDVIFSEGGRKAREVCTFFPPMKIEFVQPDGTRVLNTVSETGDGGLMMTFQFEWYMPEGTSEETKQENIKKWTKMAQTAVEKSVNTIRAMVKDGRIES